MKKILLVLLFTLINVSVFSQKITKFTFGYDKNNELVCTIRISNSTYNKTIVCVIVEIQFEKTIWDKYTLRPVYPLISYKLKNAQIPPRKYSECDFYPDQCYGKPTKIKLKKIIFSDRTFKEY